MTRRIIISGINSFFKKMFSEIKIGELMKKEKMKTVELFPLINVFVTTTAEFTLETHQLSHHL